MIVHTCAGKPPASPSTVVGDAEIDVRPVLMARLLLLAATLALNAALAQQGEKSGKQPSGKEAVDSGMVFACLMLVRPLKPGRPHGASAAHCVNTVLPCCSCCLQSIAKMCCTRCIPMHGALPILHTVNGFLLHNVYHKHVPAGVGPYWVVQLVNVLAP